MKRFIFASCLALSLAGCQGSAPLNEGEPRVFNFSALVIEQLPMSRAALKDACTALNYYRYTGGVQTGSKMMTSADTDFGTFSDEMPWGTHDLYFIGHKSEVTDFTGGVATFDKVSDTFTHHLQLTVDGDTNTNQTFTLGRSVAKFELQATDALPDNLASVQIVITGAAMSVDVATGLGGAEVVQTKAIEVPSANLGKKDTKFASFLFLPEDVESVDIAVTALDADGEEIITLEFEEVEVQTNYITRYKGQMFGRTPKFEISVSSDFAGEKEFEF